MGLAFFDKTRCIPWYNQKDCLVCEEHCPTPDKAIKFDIREARAPDGSLHIVKFPYVVEDLCIGCGICENKCPVIGAPGIYVTNANEQRLIFNS
jgi:translation initiation factor RLI1